MKSKKIKCYLFLFTLLWLAGISCHKEEFNTKNPDVDHFVTILKNGNYFDEVGYELPNFTTAHIGRLLYYLKDTTKLNGFPSNPISSKYTNPKILNECLFWTIDGIRIGNKYPSLEPCLIDTSAYSALTGYKRVSGKKLIEIANLYLNWYNGYKTTPTETWKKKKLFENTPYRWN